MVKMFTLGCRSDHSREHFDFEVVDVVKETGPAEAAVYNISIVSLLAPKTDREGKLGHPSNQFDLDMANSPR